MSESRTMSKEIAAAQSLSANMADIIGEDVELLSDMIEGETGLFEAIEGAIKRIREVEILVASIGDYESTLASRKSRLRAQANDLRTAVTVAMSVSGKDSMEFPTATISRKALGRKLVIMDESLIPADFWTPGKPTLLRKDLTAAVKEGEIPGAALDNGGETLSIRNK